MVKQELNKLVLTPAWNGLKQQILHLAQFGGSIQVIQGHSGSGKTAFFSLIQAEELGTSLVRITVSPDVSSEEFFYSLVSVLGLRPDAGSSLGQLIASLRAFVQSQHNERSRVVVAIDDVHLLNEPSLAALISVLQGNTDSGVGLHFLFFAEPGLTQLIDSLNLLDVSVHDTMLPSFSPSEIKMLLLEHFTMEQNHSSISAEQIQAIWADSKGLPGKAIHLLEGLTGSTQEKDSFFSFRGLPVVYFVALLLLCGVLLFVFVWRDGLSSDAVLERVVVPVEQEATSLASTPVLGELIDGGVIDRGVIDSRADTSSAKSSSSLAEAPVSQVFGSSVVGVELGAVEVKPKRRMVKVVEVIKESVDAIASPEVPSSPEVVGLPESNVVFNAVGGEKLPGLENSLARPVERVVNATRRVALPLEEPAPEFSRWGGKGGVKDVLLDEAVLKRHEDMLLGYSQSGFALQIMAAGDKSKLQEYIGKQANRDNLLVYKALRGGKVLYILLEGFYADKQSAAMAVANLPPRQIKAGAWPKGLRSVQGEINKNRRK